MIALGTVLGTALNAGVEPEVLAHAMKGTKCHSEPCCVHIVASLIEEHLTLAKATK